MSKNILKNLNKKIKTDDRENKDKQRLKEYESIKKNPKLKAFFWVLFSISIILLVYIFRFYMYSALLALLLFVILNPIYLKLSLWLKGRDSLASLIVILAALFIIFLPSTFLLISISKEAVKASVILTDTVKMDSFMRVISAKTEAWNILKDFGIMPADIISKVLSFAQKGINFIVENLTGIITGSFGIFFDIIIMTVLLFFLLKESKKISSIFYDLMPFPYEMEFRIVSRIERVIRDIFYGNLIIMLLQGMTIFILFIIFGVPSAILWAVIGGLFSFIPILSTSIVWIPAVIFFIIGKNYVNALLLGILSLGFAQIFENVVKPKILDRKLNIHPLILFFSLLGGMQAFGLVGLILGPAIVTLFVSFLEAYRVIEEFTPLEEKKRSLFLKGQLSPEKTNERRK